MTISATGAVTVTGDVGWSDRIFHIITGTESVTMKGLVISGGYAPSGADGGGGIRIGSGASLNLNDSKVIGNSTTGLGGGIYSYQGYLTLTNVTLSGNSAPYSGGGIFDYNGPTTLTNVTLSSNSGGGIFSGAGAITFTNVTLSGNLGFGAFNNDGTMVLTNVTLSNNGARGIVQYSEGAYAFITVTNSIIANSTGSNCDATGSLTVWISGGYNISSDGTCAFIQTGDLNNTNPKLAPLGNYGGSTQTHMLMPSSPAIDNIPNGTKGCGTTITSDQRGKPRPVNDACDSGAVERQLVDFSYWLNLPLILR